MLIGIDILISEGIDLIISIRIGYIESCSGITFLFTIISPIRPYIK